MIQYLDEAHLHLLLYHYFTFIAVYLYKILHQLIPEFSRGALTYIRLKLIQHHFPKILIFVRINDQDRIHSARIIFTWNVCLVHVI